LLGRRRRCGQSRRRGAVRSERPGLPQVDSRASPPRVPATPSGGPGIRCSGPLVTPTTIWRGSQPPPRGGIAMSERLHGLESMEALLAPEQLLPAQFGHARRDSVMCGERALMLAVLEDAIRCLEDAPRRESLVVRETLAWIRADDHEWPFSFLNLCANLE